MSAISNDRNDYVTAEEVGTYLRLKSNTVVAWARQGRIPFYRFSRKIIRYRLADVVAALEICRSPDKAEEGQSAVHPEHREP
jgi:excisionase family DNA binding protein